jgi:ribonuclease HII
VSRAPSALRMAAAGRLIAGVDEAGRGPLAGPVVAAAVIFRAGRIPPGVADSKLLDAATRTRLAAAIRRRALAYGIGWADPAEIDALDILQATFLAMRRAVLALPVAPDHLLIDGDRLPRTAGLGPGAEAGGPGCTAEAIVGGDAALPLIGAASILAKTARDAYMTRMHALYPVYEFASHKGYGTPVHRRRLEEHGPCPLHRRSFAPVAACPAADAARSAADAARSAADAARSAADAAGLAAAGVAGREGVP